MSEPRIKPCPYCGGIDTAMTTNDVAVLRQWVEELTLAQLKALWIWITKYYFHRVVKEAQP